MTSASSTHRIARIAFILSGFAVWYLSLIALAYAAFGILWAANTGAGAIVQLAITAASVLALLYLGIAFSRVLNRLWPRTLDNPAQRSGFVVVLVALALYVISLVVALEYLIADELPGSAVGIQIMSIWQLSPAVILGALLLSSIWIATVVATFLRHTTSPVVVTNSPYTLFLRRFSSISDRSVANAVMSASLPLRRIVMLVPKLTEPEDWNPVTVFMAGIRPWAPLRSSPYFLNAPQNAWVDDVGKLIAQAKIVVIDGSDVSESVATEMKLIDQRGAWPKTIVMLDRDRQEEWGQPIERTPLAVVRYICRWKAALPRLLLGVFLVIPVSVPITLPIIFFLRWLDGELEPGGIVVESVAVLVLLFVVAFLYKILFARPDMDRDSKQQLSDALASSH